MQLPALSRSCRPLPPLLILATVVLFAVASRGPGRSTAFLASPSAVAGSAASSGDICDMYAADFAANGSDSKACKRWPTRDLCNDFSSFCAGNLHKQRCEMPQMPSAFGPHQETWEQWQDFAASEGIDITQKNVTVGSFAQLLPSQMFVNRCKVCSMVFSGNICFKDGVPTDSTCRKGRDTGCFCFWQGKPSLGVTDDGYVLDGHHRWASAKIMLDDKKIPEQTTAVIDLYSDATPNSRRSDGTVARVIEAARKQPSLVKHTKCSAEE